MIIDSHVHISLYNDNARNLEEAFELFLKEMEKNNLSAAIIVPDKVIFGTDWPMCKIEEHIELVKSLELGGEVEGKVLGENAVENYGLLI